MSSEIVLISDIHANLEALEAVSKDLPKLPIYCIGDIVGYGADPVSVIRWMKERDVQTVMGNHDYAASTGETQWFNPDAAAAVEWTRRQLGSSEREYLAGLPKRLEAEIGNLNMLIVHGSPTDPLFEYVHPVTHEHLFNAYLKRYEVDIIAMGHTHIPFIWEGANGAMVNPGSIGQPRTGSPEAIYLILKAKGHQVSFEHRTVPYNTKTAAEKITKAGLPAFLAERLSRGV